MNKQIFINLPVKDVQRSRRFYESLGYANNPQFTGEEAACIVISDSIFVMLGVESSIQRFTKKAIVDPRQSIGTLISLSCESKAEVDTLVAKAVAAGGSTPDVGEDHGFMYSHSYEDPDGHGWGLFYMVPAQA